jgi:hypothetical protein
MTYVTYSLSPFHNQKRIVGEMGDIRSLMVRKVDANVLIGILIWSRDWENNKEELWKHAHLN